MKKKFFILFMVFGMFFVACKKEKTSLQDFMVNSWETTYLKLEMPTYQNSDSTQVYEDSFDNNPERVARSTYHKDGTFVAWFVTNKGETISDSEGNWKAKGDSLFVDFFYNGKQVKTKYFITKTKEGFKGINVYDWDDDGKEDDTLIMKTKSIIID
mgnify:CR=1 FL=1